MSTVNITFYRTSSGHFASVSRPNSKPQTIRITPGMNFTHLLKKIFSL